MIRKTLGSSTRYANLRRCGAALRRACGGFLRLVIGRETVATAQMRAELQALRDELQARHREIVARHEEIAARHDEIKVRHEEIAARHDEIKVRHNEINVRHDEINVRHDEIKARHDEINLRHDEINVRHDEIRGRHDEFKACHEELARIGGLQSEPLRRQTQLAEHIVEVMGRHSDSIRWLAERQIEQTLRFAPSTGSARRSGDLPLVTVIMPVWNRARCIAAAIESVQAQTYRNWELIIVDDGSDDETCKALQPHLADGRIRLLRQGHTGHSAARNRGLRDSRGALIAYLDSDNIWHPAHLQGIVDALESHPDRDSAYSACLYEDRPNGLAYILAGPLDRERLLNARMNIDLNMFAHRRSLLDRHGGFDERLTRHADCDLILRYTQDVEPIAVPIIGVGYQAGGTDRVSVRENGAYNLHLIQRKFEKPSGRPLRVLYALWHYPQLSESYVETEIRYMQRRGVEVEVWSEITAPPASPYPTTVPIHRGSLAQAIEQVQPHVVHTHWLDKALEYADIVRAAGLSLTVRGHGFEVTPGVIASLEQHPAMAAIYLFPHFAGENPHLRPKIRPMTSCFNPELYAPGAAKDPRLVVRAGVALPTKDYPRFIQLARLFPDHHFVLAICKAQGREEHVDEFVAMNESLGSPVDIRVNVSYPQYAALLQKAGIYLHTHGLEAPYGMPISIAEAMAAGCYVIGRRCRAAEAYVGPAGRLYDCQDEAASLVRETIRWNHDRWQQARRTAIEHSFHNYVDSRVLPPLLDDWVRIAGEAVDSEPVEHRAAPLDILPFPRQPNAQAANGSGLSAFRRVG